MVQVSVDYIEFYEFFTFFFIFYCKNDKTHYSVKNCVFLSFLGGIRGFFILTRDLEKKRKFFSLVLGKIRKVSLPFVVDGSDIALWRISTGRRHHLLYYSALRASESSGSTPRWRCRALFYWESMQGSEGTRHNEKM